MERIKQALARAREEQKRLGNLSLAEVRQHPTSLRHDLDIEYTETRKLPINIEHLRKHRVLIDKEHDRANAAYKLLRTQIEQRMLAKQWNTLAVTSPGPNQGKSLTCLNLAINLAKSTHHSVLLVDLDLRRPSIHKYLGYEPEYGVYDCLKQDVPLSDILITLEGVERLVIAPGRESVYNSSEMLASPMTASFVNDVKQRYQSRYIIFDLPPVLASDDAIAFSPHIDSILLVIEDGVTTKDQLKQTMEMMQGTSIMGTVLNKSKTKAGSFYYYYY